ncbi:MAG: pilus assembly protein [bacterium]|nr:pilus assembly protein [bacterium]
MRARRHRRLRGDDGTAVVEAAVFAPVFLLFVFGVLEYGLVFRDTLTINDVVGTAASEGSIHGNNRIGASSDQTADYSIVKAIREGTSTIPVDWLDKIIVYKAQGPNAGSPADQVPPLCKVLPAGPGPNCNIYDPEQAFIAVQTSNVAFFDCAAGGNNACGWDPDLRDDGPAFYDIDYLGVYIKLDREYLTGFFGDQFTIENAAISRLEPGSIVE